MSGADCGADCDGCTDGRLRAILRSTVSVWQELRYLRLFCHA
jgi:hypothetical protein